MVYFERGELVDIIRHNMIVLDDTGLTERILLPPTRKAVPGGLALELAQSGDDQLEDDQQLPSSTWLSQLLPGPAEAGTSDQSPPETIPPLKDRIRGRLLSKLREMEEKSNKTLQPVSQRPTQCTLKFEPKRPPDKLETASKTARLLAMTKTEDAVECFAEYAKFEAMAGTPNSKKFMIMFPFAENPCCSIQVHIVRTAKISDLVGLACHIYTRQQCQPPCDSPQEYDLYLAEEDMTDFDTELPPQDRQRRVAECGFPNLAMVQRCTVYRDRRPSQRVLQIQVNIFLVDKRCYTMDLENLDIPLRQVHQYAIERRREEDELIGPKRQNRELFRELSYVLEPLDQPGVVLDLDGSVSSSGTTKFVLLRVNSARGDDLESIRSSRASLATQPRFLHSKSVEFSLLDKPAAPVCGSKPTTPTGAIPQFDWANRKIRNSAHPSSQVPMSIDSLATLGRRSGTQLAQMVLEQHLLDGGPVLEEYQVNRIHRIQPRTASRLVVRERCLELVPAQQEQPETAESKRRERASGTAAKGSPVAAKAKKIPWELVAAVEVPPNSEQRANARRAVRIICLNCTSPILMQRIIETGKPGPANGSLGYEGSFWKTLLVEAAAHEAWQIGVRLSELLESRPSQVHILYQFSGGASLKPQAAAEKAFGVPAKTPMVKETAQKSMSNDNRREHNSNSSAGEKKGPRKKKLTLMLSRMLSSSSSRHE